MTPELILTEEYMLVGYCEACFDPDWDGSWSGYESWYGTEADIREAFEEHVEEKHY